MKNNLIKQYCKSRSDIDQVANLLNLSAIGARMIVVERLKTVSYKCLKEAISQL